MQKITFVNNQSPALNADNLNQLQTNVENAINDLNVKTLKAYILYNNSSGSNTSITLSDSKNNYGFLEIYYLSEAHRGSTKVSSEVEAFSLSLAIPYTSTYIRNARFSVSSTGISCTNYTAYEINSSGIANYSTNVNNNTFYITKVVGYKF